jgi:hypothetical protein
MAFIYHAVFHCTYDDGTLALPGLHFQTDVPPLGDEPQVEDVVNAIADHYFSAFLDVLPTTATWDSLELTQIPDPGEVGVAATSPQGSSGQLDVGQADLPKGVVGVISKKTNAASRSARGHIVLPSPLNEAYLDNGNWTGVYLQKMQAFAALLDDVLTLGSLQPSSLNPVVFSRTRQLEARVPYTFQVTGAVTRVKATWLRSRQSSP